MPAGLVRSGNFSKGTPITLPHNFGNVVGASEPFGNPIPQSNPSLDSNPVTWAPAPNHFGNGVNFSLQSSPPVVVIAPGSTGTVNIVVTNVDGTNVPTLSYSGAPAGVTIAFGTNPDTTTSVATITVASSVPAGRYTITITGTGSPSQTTNIHLVVN